MSSTVSAASTTPNTQTKVSTTNTNMFPMFSGPSMANDYFGSQAFGPSIYSAPVNNSATAYSTQTVPAAQAQYNDVEIPNIFNEAPDNYASALLQGHAVESNPVLKQILERAMYQEANQAATQQQVTQPAQTAVSAPAVTNSAAQTTAPTMQDYIIATQIANQFANATPIVPMNNTNSVMNNNPDLTFSPDVNKPLNVSYTA